MSIVSREMFLRHLESVQPGISGTEILEQSNAFIFKDGLVMTYDDEVACKGPSDLDESFVGVVRAEPLLGILRKLPDEELEIEEEDGEIIIRGKRRKAGIRIEKEILLPVDEIEKPRKWKKLPDEFSDALALVSQCVSRDQTKYALTCIYIHPDFLEASDGHQACRWKIRTGVLDPIMVRQRAIKHAATLGMLESSETENWIHFRNITGMILSCRKYIDGEYNDFTSVYEIEGIKTTLSQSLGEVIERCTVFSEDNAENKMVRVEMRNGKIILTGTGLSGWFREVKKSNYDGNPLDFMIAPKVLKTISSKYLECLITPERLKVEGGSYVYITALQVTTNGK